MNAFFEHHQHNIKFSYRCFDRLLLHGCIQSFLDGARAQGFFWRIRSSEHSYESRGERPRGMLLPNYVTTRECVGHVTKRGFPKPVLENRDINQMRAI